MKIEERCDKYPRCGLSAWACNALQDMVYEENTSIRRQTAIEIREDTAQLIAKEIKQAGIDALQSLPVSDFEGEDDLWFEYISIRDRDERIAQLTNTLDKEG